MSLFNNVFTYGKCNVCGKEKPLGDLVVDSHTRNKYRPLCKMCKNKQQRKQREARERREKQRQLEEAAQRLIAQDEREAITNAQEGDTLIASPRTYNKMNTVYVPDTRMFYRNNGNKHIPSRGV